MPPLQGQAIEVWRAAGGHGWLLLTHPHVEPHAGEERGNLALIYMSEEGLTVA